MNILLLELRKFSKNKIVIGFLIFYSIFIVLIAFSLLNLGYNNPSYITTKSLIFLLNFFGGIIIPCIGSYTLGLEYDCNTIKIIRTKNISLFKILMFKSIIGAFWVLLCFLIAFILSSIVGNIFISGKEDMIFKFSNINIRVSNTNALGFSIAVYLRQMVGSMFILLLCNINTAHFKKPLKAMIYTTVFVEGFSILSELIGKVLNYKGFLYGFIPGNSNYIWREFNWNFSNERVLYLLIWIVFLLIIQTLVYRTKEV